MATKKLKVKEPVVENNTDGEKEIFETDGQLTVDVYEDKSSFVVLTAIAGITAKDIEVLVDKDMLIIKGCRQNPDKAVDKNYVYQECYWGPFSRKIVLPENINANAVQTEFAKGVLTIKFPKNADKGKNGLEVEES